jgi:hypothetical protein
MKSLPVLLGGLAGAPSVVSPGPGRLHVFAAGTTNTVWQWWLKGATWMGPEPLAPAGVDGVAGIPAEGICAVSSAPNRLEVFAAGSNGNTPLVVETRRRNVDRSEEASPRRKSAPSASRRHMCRSKQHRRVRSRCG